MQHRSKNTDSVVMPPTGGQSSRVTCITTGLPGKLHHMEELLLTLLQAALCACITLACCAGGTSFNSIGTLYTSRNSAAIDAPPQSNDVRHLCRQHASGRPLAYAQGADVPLCPNHSPCQPGFEHSTAGRQVHMKDEDMGASSRGQAHTICQLYCICNTTQHIKTA